LCIDGCDEIQNFELDDFAFYDKNNHLVPLDAGLIEKDVQVSFSGYVKSPFVEDDNPGLYIQDAGPVKQW
jgi:hypothetical protein